MAEAYVENSLEFANYMVDRHWEKGWDRTRRFINGKKVESTFEPYDGRKDDNTRRPASSSSSSSSSSPSDNQTRQQSAALTAPQSRSLPVRSADHTGGTAPDTGLPPELSAAAAEGRAIAARAKAVRHPDTYTSTVEGSRRRQHNQLPEPDRDIYKEQSRDADTVLIRQEKVRDQVIREYEAETDDPIRHLPSVLPRRDLLLLEDTPEPRQASVRGSTTKPQSILKDTTASRRDSGIMASGYNDNYYGNTQYQGEGRARSAQPPKSRYYDDEDSDYDERSGKRTAARSRGYDDRYDDREWDTERVETERYRGPPVDRPYGAERRESYRSGHDGPYGAGAVAQYGRRSDGALDRTQDRESYVSRRSKSRARSDRDRSYSRSRSRSRSVERDRGDGIVGKVGEHFDTSGKGLAYGLAGAVAGGLAGRQFGQRHQQRDIIIGAIVGGLGANLAENQYREYKVRKERKEERWDDRYDGRSRSNVR